jgi:AraC-like DNA-binding protein
MVEEFAMSRTARLQLEGALHDPVIEPLERLNSTHKTLYTRELPKTIENQTAGASFERHYSIHEISELWGLSQRTLRRIFEREPGVVELSNHRSRLKRTYVTRRIPESVLRRVHRKLQKPA